MITLPADILKIEGWDGTSEVTHDNGKTSTYDNLDSKMDFAEHQRIVVAAAGLLSSFKEAACGWDADEDSPAKAAFLALKACYEDADSPHAVYIAKGIHQRDDDPHLQLHLQAPNTDKKRKFHLNVTVSRTGLDLGTGHENKFVWAPAQFVWKGANKKNYFWPKAVATVSRKRGQSMSLSDHMARQTFIAQTRAYAEFIELLTAGKYGFVKTADKRLLYNGQAVPVKVDNKTTKQLSYSADTKKFSLA